MIKRFPTVYLQQVLGVLCHVQSDIVMEENHAIYTETRTLLLPIIVYNSLDFQKKKKFQGGQQVQLLQLYFFCTYAAII